MNRSLFFFFCFVLFLTLSCRRGENGKVRVLFYYNSSGTFFSDSQHLKVATANDVIIDTVFNENTHVDKSRLIRCMDIPEQELKYVSIKVNSIDTILESSEKRGNCLAVFISYSDHEGLFNEMNQRGLDVTDNIKQFNRRLDSLNKVLGRNLCKIKINIKPDYCECD